MTIIHQLALRQRRGRALRRALHYQLPRDYSTIVIEFLCACRIEVLIGVSQTPIDQKSTCKSIPKLGNYTWNLRLFVGIPEGRGLASRRLLAAVEALTHSEFAR